MDIYQHDGATTFRFVVRGELSGKAVGELEQAWTTATSILRQRALVVDVSGVTNTDASGLCLLSRLQESGCRLITTGPPKSKGSRLGRFVRVCLP